jgi:hypothetical protein
MLRVKHLVLERWCLVGRITWLVREQNCSITNSSIWRVRINYESLFKYLEVNYLFLFWRKKKFYYKNNFKLLSQWSIWCTWQGASIILVQDGAWKLFLSKCFRFLRWQCCAWKSGTGVGATNTYRWKLNGSNYYTLLISKNIFWKRFCDRWNSWFDLAAILGIKIISKKILLKELL